MGETEYVIDEEKHILVFLITEILGDGQSGQSHPRAGSRRLVHLPVNQGCLFQNLGFFHFYQQIIPLTGSFADPGENREPAVLGGDVADQFHDDNGFSDAGSAEEADLPPLLIRGQKINDLDAGLKNLLFCGLFDERRRWTVNRVAFFELDRPHLIHRFAQDIQHPSQNSAPYRDRNSRPRVRDRHSPAQSIGGTHGHRANGLVPQMLGDFQGDVNIFLVVVDLDGVVDGRNFPAGKFNVDDRSNDLGDLSGLYRCFSLGCTHTLPPKSSKILNSQF